ncbi:hypothetical protein ACFE04_023302 [Oxalis oulophora]
MMNIWSWMCELPNADEWPESSSPFIFKLASSTQTTIQIKADRSSEFVTFTVSFETPKSSEAIWVSDACPLSDKPFLHLFLQLLREIISQSPIAHGSSACIRKYSELLKLKPEPISWIMESHSPESFSNFFDLIMVMRLFFLCVFHAPSPLGSFYFKSLLGPNIENLFSAMNQYTTVLKTFLVTVGVDIELCFMRALGYILSKWIIFREIDHVGLLTLLPRHQLGFCYGTEAHGYWILKGCVPVYAMKVTCSSEDKKKLFNVLEPKESILRYVLAHQQLEASIQFEYSVQFDKDGFIQVNTHVDNLRFQVARLGFNNSSKSDQEEGTEFSEERHFPSRIRVWVGPDIGSNYVGGLSLGRSTNNEECELEMQREVKGNFGKSKVPQVKTRARMSTKTKASNWRWDQDAEGNVAVFESVLCDNVSGREIATWKGGDSGGLRSRYSGANRQFTKSGGLVFARDAYGEGVGWRINKEMEGSVLKWRIGGQVWLTYLPNQVNTSLAETRCVEWCDEIDLPLIPTSTR